MYAGTTPTKFGRYAVAEPFRAELIHLHDGGNLHPVDHEPPLPVLDQEDLFTQGIDTSRLIPGAQRVDALGSCTCNAGTVSLAERVAAVHGAAALHGIGLSTTDAVCDETFAIELYHRVTDQTGDPSQEWPPTDCGSTGLYVATELEKMHLIKSHKSASGVTNVASLLQGGSVIVGMPFFNSWMEPDAHGFVDGNGSPAAFQAAIDSGVAGGHETCLSAAEKLTLTTAGEVDGRKSVLRVRNSWSSSWGDHGSYRLHMSTLGFLGSHADYKQFVI